MYISALYQQFLYYPFMYYGALHQQLQYYPFMVYFMSNLSTIHLCIIGAQYHQFQYYPFMNLVNCISNFNVFVFQGTALNPLRLTPHAGRLPQMNSISHSMLHVIEQLFTNPPSYFLQFN